MAKVKLFSLSLLAILIIITAYLRWSYAPPTEFFEGDDAAIATGVAHICTEGNIGPYFHSPPHLRKYEYRAFLLALEGEGEPPILEKFKNPQPPPYYRYNTMTGVYFLGALTCNWGEASQRLLMFCFIAGTLFPLFLALFLLRLFRPLPPITLPFSYLLIGLSPEIWISGSVYINDKILAVCFLTVALLFLVYLPDREIFSTFLFVVVAGLFLALAILMRFDTILFIPAILLIILFPIPQRTWKQILPRLAIVGLLFVSAGVIYFSVMRFMHASISIAMAPSTEARLFHVVLQKKFPIILAAYGWGQLVVLICLTIPGLVWLIHKISTQQIPNKIHKNSVYKAILRTLNSFKPLHGLLVIVLLTLPELVFLFSFQFSSTKYILFSSCVVAGLCIVFPFKLWQHLGAEESPYESGKRLVLATIVVSILLPISSGFIQIGEVGTADNLRYSGGWLLQRISPHRSSIIASELISCLINNQEELKSNIVVKNTSWTLEETIAYEAVIRGWQNRVVPTSAKLLNHEGNPVSYFSLNEYLLPGYPPISIFVPSDYDIVYYGDLFTDAVFAKVAGKDFKYYQDIGCIFQ